ncbi:MAG: tRNA lysidine(34) synthetase TilS [Firmicutes bacterium]|nr:tRNA lysidine(34) synthetase TilS [Bacillota bacterium]
MTDLVKTVQNTIKEHKLVKPGDFVLLGFSGGPDSLCLFHALLELRAQMGFDFAAVHINHGIRGEAADEDAAWAVNYARSHGVSCIGAVANVPAYAKKRHMTEEEAGRSVRREVFAYIAYGIATGKQIGTRPDDKRPDEPNLGASGKAKSSAQDRPAIPVPKGGVRIALAHNMDDQAETVLMRVLRGTGVHGLSGIQYRSRIDDALLRVAAGTNDEELRSKAKELDISVIRPLMDVPRSEIEAFCTENQLQPRMDHTNAETDYTRNKIRLELIPAIEKDFNPNIKEALVRLAANASEDDDALSGIAAKAMIDSENVLEARMPRPEDSVFPASLDPKPLLSSIELSASVLRKLEPAVFKRIIVSEFARLGLSEGISAVHLNALYGAVQKNIGGKVTEFPGGHTATLRGGTLTLR